MRELKNWMGLGVFAAAYIPIGLVGLAMSYACKRPTRGIEQAEKIAAFHDTEAAHGKRAAENYEKWGPFDGSREVALERERFHREAAAFLRSIPTRGTDGGDRG